jgi:hypothetical protein
MIQAEQSSTTHNWDDLDPDQQTALQVEYGHWLDTLPPTCSMQTKIERFRAWLSTRGIAYDGRPVTLP